MTEVERSTAQSAGHSKVRRVVRVILRSTVYLLVLLAALWTAGAVYFDGPAPGVGNTILSLIWIGLTVTLLLRSPSRRIRALRFAACLALVIIPWAFKQPSNDRNWAPQWAQTAGATIDGDAITFTNFRNFSYQSDGTTIERWETRTVHLSNLRGIDFFLNYWGSPNIAHPIFSFDFGEEGQIAFSVETRREQGEVYTTLGGLYKLYEITYIVGDELDLIRLRASIREGEDSYLFRLAASPEDARDRFLEYVGVVQSLEKKPRFYNVLTKNCTTAVRSQIRADQSEVFDWRLIINGKLDELLADKNLLAVKDLPHDELRTLGHINEQALEAQDDPDFSKKIRVGVPGYP